MARFIRNLLVLLPALVAATIVSAVAQQPGSPPARALEPGEVFQDCPDCAEMVVVEAGQFEMGEKGVRFETPPHRVRIAKPFAIGRNEITFREWDLCAAAGTCKYRPDGHGWGRGEQPVIDVSWDDAQIFIGWLSEKTKQAYRLPTEAEWEYAARSETTGNYAGELGTMAWYNAKASEHTYEVATKQANAWNLYDMHGNVWEYCQDWYGRYPSGTVTDPAGATSGSLRVIRGGSWRDTAGNLRSAYRSNFVPAQRSFYLGFRLLRQ